MILPTLQKRNRSLDEITCPWPHSHRMQSKKENQVGLLMTQLRSCVLFTLQCAHRSGGELVMMEMVRSSDHLDRLWRCNEPDALIFLGGCD